MRELDSPGAPVPGIIQFAEASTVHKFDEFKLQRYKARLNRDFDEFQKSKQYVLDNMHWLKDRQIPMTVTSIQSLPTHECVIVNDLLLYSFVELEEVIKAAKQIAKSVGGYNPDDDDDNYPQGA